ncbi:hypothetical protein RIF29_25044 [Crotalaria pallida]|uniref:Uncharacterized protein n=1 Tax=Crotalaria pallida TaxID=3830 RepID=A0AAN9ELE8_CROPI
MLLLSKAITLLEKQSVEHSNLHEELTLADCIIATSMLRVGALSWDIYEHVVVLSVKLEDQDAWAIVTFCLNALRGRHKISQTVWGGDWDPTNAKDLINYTISKRYKIDSWEFGNELSGKGIGASVDAAQYGKDMKNVKQILQTLYHNSKFKPSLIALGGFYQKEWFDKLLQVSGSGTIDVLSHHIYNLGPGL